MVKKELQLAPLKAQVSRVGELAQAIVIKTPDDMSVAVDILGKVKDIGKKITVQKETITKPLNEALKNARALFKPLEDSYEEMEKTIKYKMVKYQTLSEAKAEKKINRIESKIEEGSLSFEKGVEKMSNLEPESKVETDSFSLTFRITKTVEITDEKLIPREYLVPDMVLIRKDALAGKEIAGVRIVEVKTPVSSKL
mgnify:CR=1 FL=1